MTDFSKTRILIITYYWPPSAGGGVQRWLKLSNYLHDFGYDPVIFTPENPDFDLRDHELLNEIHPDTETLKFPIWEPYGIFKKLLPKSKANTSIHQQGSVNKNSGIINKLATWIRGNIFLPDPRIFWVRPSSRFLKDIIQENEIKAVISTGPPHSVHLIARKLREEYGIPWFADFRDPWSEWDLLESFKTSKIAYKYHKNLEKSVIENASLVITVSDHWARDFKRLGARKTITIPNGYDPIDFKYFHPTLKNEKNVKFLHAGLLSEMRYPNHFIDAIEKYNGNHQIVGELMGMIDEKIIERIRQSNKLNKLIKIDGYITHRKLLQLYEEVDILLLLSNKGFNNEGHLPGKLFEYMATGKFILAFGDPNGDMAEILHNYKNYELFDYEDKEGIKDFINNLNRDRFSLKVENKEYINQFNRKEQASKIAKLLDAYIGKSNE
ncbi:MAG: glycosyltransferase family 4 protein [Cyclobacteriaceae bacterium]|nr:glycosyltransferase family 4 protein [Cyclobacteriaceae bacterium]MCH8517697.1 glycosyltransferase family 4 protein [Cyclobacteriaceae bacterium]